MSPTNTRSQMSRIRLPSFSVSSFSRSVMEGKDVDELSIADCPQDKATPCTAPEGVAASEKCGLSVVRSDRGGRVARVVRDARCCDGNLSVRAKRRRVKCLLFDIRQCCSEARIRMAVDSSSALVAQNSGADRAIEARWQRKSHVASEVNGLKRRKRRSVRGRRMRKEQRNGGQNKNRNSAYRLHLGVRVSHSHGEANDDGCRREKMRPIVGE